jgi:uncharacterized protein (DUF2062 family)
MIKPQTTGFWQRLRMQVRASIPSHAELAQIRWLQPVAHRLTDPGLWHARPEALARGLAVGLFWAFVVPFGQIVFAAAHCVWWRGNIPIAAAATLITNPITIGGWLYLAYKVGSFFIGPAGSASAPVDVAAASGFLATLQSLGWPTVLGMAIFAAAGSLGGYVFMRAGSWAWFHWRVARRARGRRR